MFTREPDDIATRFRKMLEHPHARGVYFIWGHTYEFARPADRWAEMETLFAPLAGHDCVWYCTNIELFDYEAARQRVVIAANKLSAYNPSAIPVTLIVDGRLVEALPGKVVSLAS
jgi:hypothetical protein